MRKALVGEKADGTGATTPGSKGEKRSEAGGPNPEKSAKYERNAGVYLLI